MTNPQENKKKNLYVIVGIVALVSLLIRLIYFIESNNSWFGERVSNDEFSQRALLFIGIPTLITLMVIKYYGTPKTASQITFKTITLFLLMSSILLSEGALCILMAAPIFYGVAGFLVTVNERRKKSGKGKLFSFSVVIIVLLSLELPVLSSKYELQTVEVSQVFNQKLTLQEMTKSPDFMQDFPSFFKIGFPKPTGIKGQSLEVGMLREIDFLSSTKGLGTLTLEIVSKDENTIVFEPKSDNTHMDHWLTWERIEVSLVALEGNKTQVNWKSEYTCDLGPAWYFEPIEAYAVEVMNKHLIQSYFAK